MNLFVTNSCPIQSAKDHCDVHLRKMIVEVAQMLSTAHIVLDGNVVAYKKTHENHPCSVWVRKSSECYRWAYQHLKALCSEYVKRTGKVHKTEEHLSSLSIVPVSIPEGDLEPFARAMPDEFKLKYLTNTQKCYQEYLKSKFEEWQSRDRKIAVKWTNSPTPKWLS